MLIAACVASLNEGECFLRIPPVLLPGRPDRAEMLSSRLGTPRFVLTWAREEESIALPLSLAEALAVMKWGAILEEQETGRREQFDALEIG